MAIVIKSCKIYFCLVIQCQKNSHKELFRNGVLQDNDYLHNNHNYLKNKYFGSFLDALGINADQNNNSHQYNISNQVIHNLNEEIFSHKVNYKLEEVGAYFYKDTIGVISIGVALQNDLLHEERIIEFISEFRNPNNSTTKQILSGILTSESLRNHKMLSSNLKSYVLLDTDASRLNEAISTLATNIGVLYAGEDTIYKFSTSYIEKLRSNLLRIYDNWLLLCTEDILVRIYCNLDQHDKFKNWEKEYLLFYKQSILTKFYIALINEELYSTNGKIAESIVLKDRFIQFRIKMIFEKISIKFLPNAIYKKIQSALEIKNEITFLEAKLRKITDFERERKQRSLNKILIILTCLTLVSVAIDGSSIFSEIIDRHSIWNSPAMIILGCLSFFGLLYYIIDSKFNSKL